MQGSNPSNIIEKHGAKRILLQLSLVEYWFSLGDFFRLFKIKDKLPKDDGNKGFEILENQPKIQFEFFSKDL